MNKSEVMAVIDRLADKTVSPGCMVTSNQYKHLGPMRLLHKDKCTNGNWEIVLENDIFYQNERDFIILGHPIMLGDVIKKIIEIGKYMKNILNIEISSLTQRWDKTGFINKSLQEIILNTEFINKLKFIDKKGVEHRELVLKDKKVISLFDFLCYIFKK